MAKITLRNVGSSGFNIDTLLQTKLNVLLDYDTEKVYYDNASGIRYGVLDFWDGNGSSDYLYARGKDVIIKKDKIVSGHFSSLDLKQSGVKIIEISGANVDVADINKAVAANKTADFMAAVLAGNDQITGSSAGDTINGGAGTDTIKGYGGNDILRGEAGTDTLYGGTGKDTLLGGSGTDYFVFDTALNAATNVDTIKSFIVTDDTIRLDKTIFTTLGAAGATLSSAAFYKSTSGLAHDASDRIIYETDTGKLFYDSNGNAAGGAVQIAVLDKNLALTYQDFFVIA